MSRRIVLRGRFASQSLRLRPLSLGHFSKETIKAAKHSVGPARENPCPTLAGAVFSQTLHSHLGPNGHRMRLIISFTCGHGFCFSSSPPQPSVWWYFLRIPVVNTSCAVSADWWRCPADGSTCRWSGSSELCESVIKRASAQALLSDCPLVSFAPLSCPAAF